LFFVFKLDLVGGWMNYQTEFYSNKSVDRIDCVWRMRLGKWKHHEEIGTGNG